MSETEPQQQQLGTPRGVSSGRPWLWVLLPGLIAVTLLCWFAFDYGFGRGHGIRNEWLAELDALRQRSVDYEQEISDLLQQLSNLRRGARIDRKAAEQVREEVVASEARIAALEEDLTFYRGLMTPTATEQGLSIRSFKLYPADRARSYRYELIVQQLAVNHGLLQGRIRLGVRGRRGELEETLSIEDLSPDQDESLPTFRFRYFQKLEGLLTLPDDFQADAIKVAAETRGKWPKKAQKQFEWLVEKG